MELISALKEGAIASLISSTFKREHGSIKPFIEDLEAQSSGIVKKEKGKGFVEEVDIEDEERLTLLRMA